MALAISLAQQRKAGLHFEICPNWANGACDCPKDTEGNLLPTPPLPVAHPPFDFAVMPSGWTYGTGAPPDEWLILPDPTNAGETRTAAEWSALQPAQQWAFQTAIEAIRLVKHEMTAAGAEPIGLPNLVGFAV